MRYANSAYRLTDAETRALISAFGASGSGPDGWRFDLEHGLASFPMGGHSDTFERDMAKYGITVECDPDKAAPKGRAAITARYDILVDDVAAEKYMGATAYAYIPPRAEDLRLYPWATRRYPFGMTTGTGYEIHDTLRAAGIVVEPVAPARIDKHAVADAIEKSICMCLDGTHTGTVPGCPVCQVMGHTVNTVERVECQRCPLGPSALPSVGLMIGCGAAAEAIKAHEVGAAARIYAIIDTLRATTGDDRWIEMGEKKPEITDAAMADILEGLLKNLMDGKPRERCPVSGGRTDGGSCARCPLSGGTCCEGFGVVTARDSGWFTHVATIVKAIEKLRGRT